MTGPQWQLKKLMCEVGHRIWLRGYCAGNEGNHSARIGDDRVLCTPTGLSKGFLHAEDMCVVDMDGNQVEPNTRGQARTSEVLLHLAIYKKRPDVQAVIHSHPPHATAFAVANVPIPEGIHPEAEVFLGKVPFAPYATPSTHELPDSVVKLVGEQTNTVIMGNHGTVSFSPQGLMDAYYKLEILDAYCRILLLTSQLGRVNTLSQNQVSDLLNIKSKFGMGDDRLACVADGCVGQDNEPFLSTLDVRPASASCSCNGGHVQATTGTPMPADGAPNGVGAEQLETLVQTITDEIMANSEGTT